MANPGVVLRRGLDDIHDEYLPQEGGLNGEEEGSPRP